MLLKEKLSLLLDFFFSREMDTFKSKERVCYVWRMKLSDERARYVNSLMFQTQFLSLGSDIQIAINQDFPAALVRCAKFKSYWCMSQFIWQFDYTLQNSDLGIWNLESHAIE